MDFLKYYNDPQQPHSLYGLSLRGFVVGFLDMDSLLRWYNVNNINIPLKKVSVDEVYEECMQNINFK